MKFLTRFQFEIKEYFSNLKKSIMAKTLKIEYLIGWIQTLSRRRVKSQSLGNPTLNSESASKMMPACDI